MNTLRPDLREAERLLHAGLQIVKLKPNLKEPAGDDWNHRPARSIDPQATGYGLLLQANKVCSVDPDRWDDAVIGMRALGFDLEQIMAAGVRTLSTRHGSGGRSAFAAEGDISWLKFRSKATGTVLELRAHSENLQDTIPGLVYITKSGEVCTQTYANCRRLDDVPPLPDDLFAWWEKCSTDIEFLREQERMFFAAIGTKATESISTGRTGGKLAFDAPGVRGSFNAVNDVPTILTRHSYSFDKKTRRWAPPTATGEPGVRPIPGKDGLWRSDHASDPLSGTFDAWIAYVVLDHGGDMDAAVAQWKKDHTMFGNTHTPPARADNRPSRSYDAGDLVELDMPDPIYICRPWVSEGVTLVVGRPKIGKTTWLRDLALQANVGGTFLTAPCAPADVLFLSLEEGERIMRKKLRTLGVKPSKLRGIRMEFEWPQGADGVDKLRQWLKKRTSKRTPLVVIDSLTRFRTPPSARGHQFTEDYTAVKLLADLCKEFPGLVVLVLHHTTKASPDDPVSAISGTYGLTAAADNYLILLKQGHQFRLHAGGRLWEGDASDFELRREAGGWAMAGEWDMTAPQSLPPKQQQVIELLKAGAKTNKTLAELTKQTAPALSHMLGKMAEHGLIVKCANGWEIVR